MADTSFRRLDHGTNDTLDTLFDNYFRSIEGNERKFKNCSTAMLSITFILMLGYLAAKFIHNRKTDFGRDVNIKPC